MSLQTLTLTVEQACDATFGPWIWSSPDPGLTNNFFNQVYYNFTGAGARFEVRAQADPTSSLLLSLTSGAGIAFSSQQTPDGPPAPAFNNAFGVTITAAQTVAFSPGTFFYDLFIDWPNGTHQRFLTGNFVVLVTVVR